MGNPTGSLSTDDRQLRTLSPQWNSAMIAASIAISFLGAFTSTQLMCHARMSARISSVFAWSLLGSLIFGFCSIWSLHEVAMLACEFDLLIGIDPGLTILSAIFAVGFTFISLAADLLWERWQFRRQETKRRKWRKTLRSKERHSSSSAAAADSAGNTPLLEPDESDHDDEDDVETPSEAPDRRFSTISNNSFADPVDYHDLEDYHDSIAERDFARTSQSVSSGSVISKLTDTRVATRHFGVEETSKAFEQPGSEIYEEPSYTTNTSEYSWSRRPSTQSGSGSFGLGALGLVPRGPNGIVTNPFIAIATSLYQGCTIVNLSKGFVWSLAIDSMHYVGILGLRIPNGFCTFNPWLVILSGIISWIVCCVGSILMARMETHLPQQILFSIIAAAGVASMHFTGMAATTFHSTEPASERRGYPPALANAVVGIAFITCITANVLLAHAATVSRNKLAEIVWTRKELWRAIALKETAEAATRARSDFIASASHELRTPLHHLQGYSDLLAQEELTGEGRKLLNSIQRALKTLSHITNNVLDWSKYERNTEGSHQPVALDIRQACESIIVLLPNVDEEANVELYVVIGPDVPTTVFLDEDWIHRILMNLLSNALKFTKSGYIMLLIERHGDKLHAVVRDTGCGLASDFIPQMWEPFKQGEVRGSARGTGLGLSIIRQLLGRMNGSVTVESRYIHDKSIAPGTSGTTFTVVVPLQTTGQKMVAAESTEQNVAILSKAGDRSTEGLVESWQAAGFMPQTFASVSDISTHTNWKYVWANLDYLQDNVAQFNELVARKDLFVLVPYDTSDSLDNVTGILSASNIVLLQKPLLWHTFEKKVAMATQQRQQSAGPSRALRFASDVEVLNGASSIESSIATLIPEKSPNAVKSSTTGSNVDGTAFNEKTKPKKTIMLVEDNPVNQKLGQKMLTSLGYAVVVANDGQECIDLFTSGCVPSSTKRYPSSQYSSLTSSPTPQSPSTTQPPPSTSTSSLPIIDGVLMDQSMPRKDGVTATAELRALEENGDLKGRVPERKRLAIVALTAVVNAESKEQFRIAGADDFLPKPLTLRKLRDTLEIYFEQQQ